MRPLDPWLFSLDRRASQPPTVDIYFGEFVYETSGAVITAVETKFLYGNPFETLPYDPVDAESRAVARLLLEALPSEAMPQVVALLTEMREYYRLPITQPERRQVRTKTVRRGSRAEPPVLEIFAE